MKTKINLIIILVFSAIITNAQSFTTERIINAPAEKVWKVVGEQYGEIANSHPTVVASDYISNDSQGGEGCERVCYLNEEKTKYTHEKQLEFDSINYRFKVQISHVEGIPLNPDFSYGIYKVIPIDENSCKLVIEMNLKTSPAFLGVLAKGKFKKNIEDYQIAIQHNVLTGEHVTKDNFKEIKKKYQS